MVDLVGHVQRAFSYAEKNESKVDSHILGMEGMSGNKTRHFYNQLCSLKEIRYLEIGVWKGSSTCAAMCGNQATILGIDNWSEFGGPKEEFLKNFNTYKGQNNAFFLEANCFQLNSDEIRSKFGTFNVYMYDGPHSGEDHFQALSKCVELVDDTFVFIVDDWNWDQVREGTQKAIDELKLKILYNKSIRLTTDGSTTMNRESWWNGIYCAVLQKSG